MPIWSGSIWDHQHSSNNHNLLNCHNKPLNLNYHNNLNNSFSREKKGLSLKWLLTWTSLASRTARQLSQPQSMMLHSHTSHPPETTRASQNHRSPQLLSKCCTINSTHTCNNTPANSRSDRKSIQRPLPQSLKSSLINTKHRSAPVLDDLKALKMVGPNNYHSKVWPRSKDPYQPCNVNLSRKQVGK